MSVSKLTIFDHHHTFCQFFTLLHLVTAQPKTLISIWVWQGHKWIPYTVKQAAKQSLHWEIFQSDLKFSRYGGSTWNRWTEKRCIHSDFHFERALFMLCPPNLLLNMATCSDFFSRYSISVWLPLQRHFLHEFNFCSQFFILQIQSFYSQAPDSSAEESYIVKKLQRITNINENRKCCIYICWTYSIFIMFISA